MASCKVTQITSIGNGAGCAFMNVREEYGHVKVWTAIHNTETYLLVHGQEVQFVQFDRDVSKESIQESFNEYRESNYKIFKVEEDGIFKPL